MHRRTALGALAGLGTGALCQPELSAASQLAAQPGLPPVTISDVKVILTQPGDNHLVIVKVLTSEPGLYGVGCATHRERPLLVAEAIEKYLKPLVVGRRCSDIEDIWQRVKVDADDMCAEALGDGSRDGQPMFVFTGPGQLNDQIFYWCVDDGGVVCRGMGHRSLPGWKDDRSICRCDLDNDQTATKVQDVICMRPSTMTIRHDPSPGCSAAGWEASGVVGLGASSNHINPTLTKAVGIGLAASVRPRLATKSVPGARPWRKTSSMS